MEKVIQEKWMIAFAFLKQNQHLWIWQKTDITTNQFLTELHILDNDKAPSLLKPTFNPRKTRTNLREVKAISQSSVYSSALQVFFSVWQRWHDSWQLWGTASGQSATWALPGRAKRKDIHFYLDYRSSAHVPLPQTSLSSFYQCFLGRRISEVKALPRNQRTSSVWPDLASIGDLKGYKCKN